MFVYCSPVDGVSFSLWVSSLLYFMLGKWPSGDVAGVEVDLVVGDPSLPSKNLLFFFL